MHLTERARGLAPELAVIAADVNGQALRGLSREEAEELMALLGRVIDNLGDHGA